MDSITVTVGAAYTAYYDEVSDEELIKASEWADFVAPALAEVVWNE